MARPALRKKTEISEAIINLRAKFGDSQQAFSNRLGIAIQTVARWETVRPPTGQALFNLAVLATDMDCAESCRVFVEKYFSDIVKSTVGRGGLQGPLRKHFDSLLSKIASAIDANQELLRNPKVAQLVLNQVCMMLERPHLRALKNLICQLEELGEKAHLMASSNSDVGVLSQDVERIKKSLGEL